MPAPAHPKIYHILHVDKLASVLTDGELLCDAVMMQRPQNGTMIGMNKIKQRRLALPVKSQPGLMVGACVPFYFCSRSVMLYLIWRGDSPELTYQGGQSLIIHL